MTTTTALFVQEIEQDGRSVLISLVEHYTILIPGKAYRTDRHVLEVTGTDGSTLVSVDVDLNTVANLAAAFSTAVADMIRA